MNIIKAPNKDHIYLVAKLKGYQSDEIKITYRVVKVAAEEAIQQELPELDQLRKFQLK